MIHERENWSLMEYISMSLSVAGISISGIGGKALEKKKKKAITTLTCHQQHRVNTKRPMFPQHLPCLLEENLSLLSCRMSLLKFHGFSPQAIEGDYLDHSRYSRAFRPSFHCCDWLRHWQFCLVSLADSCIEREKKRKFNLVDSSQGLCLPT